MSAQNATTQNATTQNATTQNATTQGDKIVTAVDHEQRMSDTFAALSSTTRRAILVRLAEGEADVNELAAPFSLSLPAISKHLKVLERAGLIERGRRAQYRPCTLNAAPLAEIADWTEQYRPIWENRLDRLADYLERLQDDESQPTQNKDTSSS